MLQLKNIVKAYSERPLLSGVSFAVGRGERIGVVGRNGHGKTTLFRIITGEEQADAGELLLSSGYRLGYLQQKISFTQDSVRGEAEEALRLQEGGWKESHKAEQILFGLGFDSSQLLAAPQQLSGGFQVRLQLAKVLLAEPNLLLLDEPTNYLDIVALRWLERFLRDWPGELLLITHDRGFMDRVVTHVLGIHRQQVLKIQGVTAKYYDKIQAAEEAYERTRLNLEKKREQQMVFVERFRAKNTKASAVQSRLKALDRMGQLDELQALESLSFCFPEEPFPGPFVLQCRDLGFGYDPALMLIENLDLAIRRRERLAVVGKNGKGKSTLLRLLAGELEPKQGLVQQPENLRPAYFGQTNVDRLNPENTIEAELMAAQPIPNQTAARGIAGALLFAGEQALKSIKLLSGGERSRVLLGKILAAPSNLLLLDEPTNHLDMEATDALLAALQEYRGAIVIVTHNERLLNTLAERLVVFDRGRVTFYEGSYQDFIERVGWSDEEEERPTAGTSERADGKKEQRRRRAEVIKRRAAELRPLEAEIAALEDRIVALEEQVAAAGERLSRTAAGRALVELSLDLKNDQAEIEDLFEVLSDKSKLLEERLACYEKELEQV